jgi:hypothetical protein
MKSKLYITANGKLAEKGPVYIRVDGIIIGKVWDGPYVTESIFIKLDTLKLVP